MQTVDFERFVLAAARYRLDMADANEVIDTAAQLATQPATTGAVTEISALSSIDARREDLLPLIDQALAEVNRATLDVETAARIVARNVAADVIANRVEPYEGARRLWRMARKVPETETALSPFIHLASEWEDVPDQRAAIETDIKTEAAKLTQS